MSDNAQATEPMETDASPIPEASAGDTPAGIPGAEPAAVAVAAEEATPPDEPTAAPPPSAPAREVEAAPEGVAVAVEVAAEASAVTALEAPVEDAPEAPVPVEAPVETAPETPAEAVEAPAVAALDAPVETAPKAPVPVEAPVEMAPETSAEAVETPAVTALEAPVETAPETPVETAPEAPILVEAPVETAPETPAAAVETPAVAATEAPPADPEPAAAAAATAEPAADAAGDSAVEERGEDGEASPRQQIIDALRRAKEEATPVEGCVIGWNNGGFHVSIDDVAVFCPRSEMELGNPKSPKEYIDRTFQFRVLKHQKRGRRIVVSRKAILAEERELLAAELRPKLIPGADLPGHVSSLTDFGAFVDLGGLEGLVHLSELSRRRVGHPKEMLKSGQPVTVRVLKVEEEGDRPRISLSMKVLEPDPYVDFAASHPRGSDFSGKVARKTDFGVFVEVAPGLDGMIHVSQLAPGSDLSDPHLEPGQEVSGWVVKTEPERQRISLTLRPVPSDDPWKGIEERLSEGSVVQGEVEDVAPFGVFILLEPGLTGLLPNSEINLPRGQDKARIFRPGNKVRVQVVSLDRQRKRISLATEDAKISGTRADYKDYVRQQKKDRSGMTAMAAAFAKLREAEGQEKQT